MKRIDHLQSALLFLLAGFSTLIPPNDSQIIELMLLGFRVVFFALFLLSLVFLIITLDHQNKTAQNK